MGRLLDAVFQLRMGNVRAAEAAVSRVRRDHERLAEESVMDEHIRESTIEALKLHFEKLESLMQACRVLEEVSHRTANWIMSFGETSACILFAAVLQDMVRRSRPIPVTLKGHARACCGAKRPVRRFNGLVLIKLGGSRPTSSGSEVCEQQKDHQLLED